MIVEGGQQQAHPIGCRLRRDQAEMQQGACSGEGGSRTAGGGVPRVETVLLASTRPAEVECGVGGRTAGTHHLPLYPVEVAPTLREQTGIESLRPEGQSGNAVHPVHHPILPNLGPERGKTENTEHSFGGIVGEDPDDFRSCGPVLDKRPPLATVAGPGGCAAGVSGASTSGR